MRPQPVFLSYSRQQFYFAESLALQLQRRGVDVWFDVQRLLPGDDWAGRIAEALQASAAVVVVASRGALASSYVEGEWRAALAAGKPVLVALAEEADLPPALEASAQVADFRSSFDRGLDTICQGLSAPAAAAGRSLRAPLPQLRMPRDVALVAWALGLASSYAVAVAAAAAVYGLVILPSQRRFAADQENGRVIASIVGTTLLLVAARIFFAWQGFVRRRFDYTSTNYLALSAAVIPLIPAAVLFRPMDQWGLPLFAYAPLVLTGVVLTLLGWWGAWLLHRSEDLFRWYPTGEAPESVRRRHLKQARPLVRASDLDLPPRPFQVLSCPADASVAKRIEAVLHRTPKAGDEQSGIARLLRGLQKLICRRADAEPDPEPSPWSRRERRWPHRGDVVPIVVISNKTPKAWVNELLARHGSLVSVAVSGVMVPADRPSLMKHQWVDYRGRSDRQLALLGLYLRDADPERMGQALEVLPESLEKPAFPTRLAFGIKLLQGAAGAYIGFAAVELLVWLVNRAGPGTSDPVAIAARFIAGLGLAWAVGAALDRRVRRQSLWTVLVLSWLPAAVILLAAREFGPLLQLGVLPFAFPIGLARFQWLPDGPSESSLGPTFALHPLRVWGPHLLWVAGIALQLFIPFCVFAIWGR